MKDYSKLGDWEVNRKIAKLLYPDHNVMCYPHNADGKSVGVELHKGGNLEWFDYCNTVQDAWPIILENKIWLRELFGIWQARGFPTNNNPLSEVKWEDVNPLRSAMIVFLMMNDVKGKP